jgi:hypothetical protein
MTTSTVTRGGGDAGSGWPTWWRFPAPDRSGLCAARLPALDGTRPGSARGRGWAGTPCWPRTRQTRRRRGLGGDPGRSHAAATRPAGRGDRREREVDLLTERQASILSRSSVKMYRSPPPVVTTFASILPRPFAGSSTPPCLTSRSSCSGAGSPATTSTVTSPRLPDTASRKSGPRSSRP